MTDLTFDRYLPSALRLLAGYTLIAMLMSVGREIAGTGSMMSTLAYTAVLLCAVAFHRHPQRGGSVAGWLPFLAMPALYAALPSSMLWSNRLFDPVVQQWDHVIFGGQPSRGLAVVFPTPWVSELLHLAYLSYYAIIYVPALIFWIKDRQGFVRLAFAFTAAMVTCFFVFSIFPVAGPRYQWVSPLGDGGLVRQIVLRILERGSSRGTAFPSSHVAIALAIAWSSMRRLPSLGWLLWSLSVLLTIGAVYGGFHYGTDAIVGAAVGVSVGVASDRIARTAAPA